MIAEKKDDIGKVKEIKLGKLNNVSWNMTFNGTSLPVDFLSCSTKSPINRIDEKIIKTTQKVYKNLFNI
tara:strand:+ start:427 stop:633 length:207 start_codon:yes stop_codon:yes gene_type:complete